MIPEIHIRHTRILSPVSRLAAKRNRIGGMLKRCQDKMTV